MHMYQFRLYILSSILLLFSYWNSFGQTLPPSGTPQQSSLQVYYPFDVSTSIGSNGPSPAQWAEFGKEASQISLNGWSDVTLWNSGVSIGNDGVRGNCLYSDGSAPTTAFFHNGTSQNSPINDIISGTNSFTVSFWYKLEHLSSSPTAIRTLLGKRKYCNDFANGGHNTFFDVRASKASSSNNGIVHAEIEEHQDNSPVQWLENSNLTSITEQSCNEWINCVITRSLVNTDGNCTTRLYIDGILRSTDFSEVVNIGIGQSSVFEIGGSPCTNIDGTREFFGSFDELMVYDSELTEMEVAQLYTAYTSNLNVSVSGATNLTCGQSTTLTANTNSGSNLSYSYLWSPGGETTQSITVSPTSNQIYTLTAFNSECETTIAVPVSVTTPELDPSFTVTSIECNSYDDYTVTLSGTGPGFHFWQVYEGDDMNTPVANEMTSIGIYGTTQFNVTINIPGSGGDKFVIKHGIYDQCVPWSEQRQLIELPCYSNLDSGFDINYSCNDQSPEIKVTGVSNPCNTKWLYQLFDGSVLVDQIGYATYYTEAYDNNEYTFSGLEECKEYTVKHGVWSECNSWIETIHSISTSNCPELIADFHFQNTQQGGITNVFYTCNSGIFFNGTFSQGESQYYIDLWKLNPVSGQFDHLGYKNGNGWTSGQAGIFDLVSEFGPQGISFNPGTYKVKLAVANNCNGWLPIEKTFIIEESIGTPSATFGTYDASLGSVVKTTFVLGDDVWIQSPLAGAPANNLTDYRFELERIISYSPFSTMAYGITFSGSGPINPFELSSIFGIQVHSQYRLTCFAINECGEEVSFYQDFEVIKPSPKILLSGDTSLTIDGTRIYPNPVRDILHIKTEKEIDRVEIYAKSGQLISIHKSTSIEVSSLPSGMYTARLIVTNGLFEEFEFMKQ